VIFCRANCTGVDTFWTNFVFWYCVASFFIGIACAAWIARNPEKSSWLRINGIGDAAFCWGFHAFMWPILAIGWVILPSRDR
jgi:hypothetical protein